MQFVNSVQPRPTSVTVICVLGIIYASLDLLLAFLGLISLHLGIFLLDGLIGGGFLFACLRMLDAKRSGKTLYHIISGIWFFFSVITMPSTVMAHSRHTNVPPVFYVFFFMLFAACSLVFNIMLASDQIKDYWKD